MPKLGSSNADALVGGSVFEAYQAYYEQLALLYNASQGETDLGIASHCLGDRTALLFASPLPLTPTSWSRDQETSTHFLEDFSTDFQSVRRSKGNQIRLPIPHFH